MEPYSLRGERCELTPFTPADTQRVFDYCQDSEIQRWTGVPTPYRMEDAAVFTTSTAQKGWDPPGFTARREWAIRVPRQGGGRQLVGAVSLRPDASGGSAAVRYLLAADSRGRGIATDAVNTAVAHAIRDLGMRRVVWSAVVGNWPSRRLAVRCGFKVEGAIRSETLIRGQAFDAWVGTILAEDLGKDDGYWTEDGRVRIWD
ncbi:MAG: GNAT family N-acetyltransferase [Bifidobacteriaceae bacterium]|jgi:RimJ/RimL family protein N-acetyltransferase|nr:GNAT family N-acetyltransferase [Bifidobacteriaceae bacterium]